MFAFLAFLTGFSALAMLIAGSLSLLRNQKQKQNQWFFFLTAALAVWVPANFLGSNVTHEGLTDVFVKLDFIFALFVGWFLLQFVASFITNVSRERTGHLEQSRSFRIVTTVLNFAFVFAIFMEQILTVSTTHDTLTVTTKSGFLLYTLTVIFYFGYALQAIFISYLKARYHERQQLSLLVLGFFFAVLGNILTNLVFPNLIHERELVKQLNTIGYIGNLLLVLFVYIAITRRRLFDIRFVITRSLAYIFLLGSVGAVYATVITLLSYLLVPNNDVNASLLVVNLGAMFFVSITFQYLKQFFSRLTDRIFYRNVYDTQELLNALSNITTSTLEPAKLLSGAAHLISDTLKSGSCVFVLIDKDKHYERQLGMMNRQESYKDFTGTVVRSLKPHTPLVVDYLELSNPLKQQANDLGVEVCIPLYANKTLSGFMALSTKQTGTAYTSQDTQLLMIMGDSLAVALQNALRFEEIENFNVTLQGKVDDATHKLRQTNEKLKSLDETKDEFISMASHQLRTPLTSMKGYVSMVLEGDAGKLNAQQKKLLDQAFLSSQRMVYLIADLLNVSRLRTGKFVIEAKPTNLADVIEGELTQLTETAKSRNLELIFKKPDKFPVLNLDDTKIRQVIMNFTDNAIYYTPAGGHITVNLEDKGQSVEFTVVDDGIGVPKHEQHHLFNKFYRAGNARKARPDGTGLGLFMAKKVIVAQGGAVIFHSSEGKGSTFGFSFPKHKLLATPVSE